jgi:predicted Rossmann fold nucleotide-binding protein DprA/Smf involved in DNA uptake
MTNIRALSDDSKAVLMLCSRIGQSGADVDLPLRLKEWKTLEEKISRSDLQRPGALLGLAAEEIAEKLGIVSGEAERLARLLERGGMTALELDQFAMRGIWCVTLADESYPARLLKTMGHLAPAVLFGAGEVDLLERRAVAVVGSRNLDQNGERFARAVGEAAAKADLVVVSGGAKGSDRFGMQGALDAGGGAIGVMADSLERSIKQPDVRQFLADGRLVFITPYHPRTPFSVGAAMGRNKIIYGFADFAVIVSSEYRQGGTWAGAEEALKNSFCPLLVRADASAGTGNEELIKRGSLPITESDLDSFSRFDELLKQRAVSKSEPGNLPEQGDLLALMGG